MKKLFLSIFLSLSCLVCLAQDFNPTATVKFSQKDSCELYFDYYAPVDSMACYDDGSRKPTIMFAFGGGFRSGSRREPYFLPWFTMLNEAGYGVVAIDYRLGMAGFKYNVFKIVGVTEYAIRIAVEDMFSATNYLLEHGRELGIDPCNIVISGSSAGAITALQAEYELANRNPIASVLPENFQYAGVMSFSGAILSVKGNIRYKTEPCPQLLFHGDVDKMVKCGKIKLFNLCFAGSGSITESLNKAGYVYTFYCYTGNMHEISAAMSFTFPEQLRFLEENVWRKSKKSMTARVTDSSIPVPDWARGKTKELY